MSTDNLNNDQTKTNNAQDEHNQYKSGVSD